MEESNHGWVMFHRRSLLSSVWKNPIIWWVWSWCLLKANHQDNIFPFNGKDIEVKRGQFITGLFKASSELKLPPQKVRTAWRYLINTQRITNEATNQFTLITILNWDKYQPKDKQSNKRITNEQQTDNKRLTTNNNDNNDNNVNNDKKGLANAKRVEQSFKKEDYVSILEEYQKLKGIKLQGAEFLPYQQAIKTMFMSGRTKENIIACMQWLAKGEEEWMENWTLKTAKMKMPEFLSGNFKKSNTLIIK